MFSLAAVIGINPISAQEKNEIPEEKKTNEQKIEDTGEKKEEQKPEEKTTEEKITKEKTAEEQKGETKKKTGVYTIGEIIVRSKALASVEDASVTTELTPDSLKSRSEKTLDQALGTVPGVRVFQGKKGQMNFDMHGFQHNTVALLVDGLPFEEIYDGGGGDISRILVMNASKIIVNRGTSSALYGSRGSFGSINVITKKPERLFFEGSTEIDHYGGYAVNVSGGGVYKDFYFLLSASIIKNNSYEISSQLGRHKRFDWMNKLIPWTVYGYSIMNSVLNPVGLESILDSGRWNHTDSTKYYASGKAGYAVTKNIEFGISTTYYQGTFSFNGFETSAFSSYVENGTWSNPRGNPPGISMFQNRAWTWPKDYRVNVAPYITMEFGDFNLRAIYYYTHQANVLDGWTNQAESAMFDGAKRSEHDEKSNGFYIYPSYKFTNWNKLTGVIHYSFDEYNAYKKRIGAFASGTPNYYTPWFKTALMTAKYVDVGIEDEFKFNTNYGDVKFSLGLSYDAQKLSRNFGGRYAPIPFTPGARPVEDISGILRPRVKVNPTSDIWGTGDSFDPVIAVLYEPIKEMLKIRGTFSRKVKFPTLHEYSDTADVVDNYYYNPTNATLLPFVIYLNQIKPEIAYNASFGAELTLFNRALSIREDYFYSFYKNKLVSIGDPNSDVGNKRWTNIDGADVHGLESTIGSNLGTDKLKVVEMNASLTYVLTSAKDRLGSHALQGERVKEVPMHQIIMQLKWDFISGTSLNIWSDSLINQIVYIQQLPPSILGSPSLFTMKLYGTRRIHDPFMLNIRVSQRIVDHFDVWIMCKNITDDYSSDPFNPGPGRTWYFGADAEF
jgi:outer membrane receptor protein involved in Fe transport